MCLRIAMLIALATIGLAPLTARAATWGGTVGSGMYMSRAASPHYVISTLTIPPTVTFTIEPGAYVYFSAGAALEVQGKLIADASTGTRIVMGFNGPNGTYGSWPGIRFRCCGYAKLSVMKNVELFYGGTATEGAIWIDRITAPTIYNVSIWYSAGPGFSVNTLLPYTLRAISAQNCLGHGVVASGSGTDLLLQAPAIVRSNGGNGVDLRAGANLRVNGLTNSDNTGWAFGGEPDTSITSVASLTMSGNGAGARNAFGTRAGTISYPITWTAHAALPRYVTGVVTVPSGKTLTIPSQTVRFTSGAALEIQGTLTSTGTSGTPVTLTTSATTPAPGGWDGVRFRSTASTASTLTYTTISYATTGLLIDGYSGTLANTSIASSSLEGIRIQGATARPTFNAVSVNNGQIDAIHVATGAGATVNNPTLTGNQGYAFSVDQATSPLTITGVTPPASGGNFNNAIRMRATSIAADETWLLPPLPWVITADLTIQYGRTVTLPAGTTIRFASGKVLYAQGTLIANGTLAQPVLLTSNQSVAAPGDWGGLSMGPYRSPARLTHVVVEYAGKTTASRPAVSIWSSNPVLDSLTVQQSFADGVHVYDSLVSGSRLTVLDSAGQSIKVYDAASRLTLPNSRFEGNAQGIQFNTGTPVIDLRLSYWGHASGPSLGGPGSGEPVPAGLLYEPWLIGAPSTVNYFTAVTAKNRSFNPSVGVVAHIDHTEQLASTWTLRVYSGATLIRTLMGTTAFAEWDGRDTGGTILADGTYRWEFAANAAGQNATPASGLAIVDSTKQLIETFALSERYFSPNADGIKDSTTAHGMIGFSDSTWSVTIKNASGIPVRTMSAPGTIIEFEWNGRSDSGVMQLDGAYTAELTVNNFSTVATRAEPVDLDSTPPTAAIAAPVEDGTVSNIYAAGTAVRATAQDPHFSVWTLEAGPGAPPTSLTQLAVDDSPANDEQIALWDSFRLSGDRLTFRLTVTDLAGNSSVVDRHVWKRDFSASQKGTWEFNPDTATVTYESIVPLEVDETLTIHDEAGQIVRTVVNNVRRTPGTYQDVWNGRDNQGNLVPDGGYSYRVNVRVVSDGALFIWDRQQYYRAQSSVRSALSLSSMFDPFDNIPLSIAYALDGAYRVSLRGSVLEGTVASECTAPGGSTRCLSAREYQPSGSKSFVWAGTDAEGNPILDVVSVGIVGLPFPENVVVKYGGKPVISSLRTDPAMFGPASATQQILFNMSASPAGGRDITVRFKRHEGGAVIRTIAIPAQPQGSVTVNWDGRADNGLWAPPGAYTVIVEVADSLGNRAVAHALTTVRY